MQGITLSRLERHTTLASRNKHRVKLIVRAHRFSGVTDFFVRLITGTNDSFKLGQIGRNHGRAAIACEISTFRINKTGNILLATNLNQGLNTSKCALGVITQQHNVVFSNQIAHVLEKHLIGIMIKELLKVHANELLVPAQYSKLNDRLSRARHYRPPDTAPLNRLS